MSAALISEAQVIAEFCDALNDAGLGVPKAGLQADGQLHRYQGEDDKPGRRNAWYVLHLDGCPAGAFGSWRTGFSSYWRAKSVRANPVADECLRRAIAKAKARADSERRTNQCAASFRALSRWNAANAADPSHKYLTSKRVLPHGIRQHGTALLIPLIDADGKLWNIQTIQPDGTKRFQKAARVTGCFAPVGTLPADGDSLYICEGWATAATLHSDSGLTVLAAMNAGNLKHVAIAARDRWPRSEIVICGDDDRNTPGNPGRTKANEAAVKIGATVAFPTFSDGESGTDFNDLANLRRRAA